jgi:hypothetical protein
MNAINEGIVELDPTTSSRIVELAAEKADHKSTAALVMIERLRRLEEDARCLSATRQTLQKITSARRILGDRAEFGCFQGPFPAE